MNAMGALNQPRQGKRQDLTNLDNIKNFVYA